MDYLKIKNWETFQQYKDRDPKWIKLHRNLLRDYEFGGLSDSQKCCLLMMWLIAAETNNKIPNDPKWIMNQGQLKTKPDIKQLVTAGFLLPYSPVQPCTETYLETETETETETERGAVDLAVESYNQLAERINIPIMQKLSQTRKSSLLLRLKDCDGIDGWHAALGKLEASPFCQGNNDKGWKADFDFLVRESSFIKLMEGKYDATDIKELNRNSKSNRAKDAIARALGTA